MAQRLALKSFLIIGDSTSDGTLDIANTGGNAVDEATEISGGGWVRRALWNIDGNPVPCAAIARNGTSVVGLLSSMDHRKQYFRYFTHAECGYGNVEMLNATPVETITLLLKRLFLTLRANGIEWITLQEVQPRTFDDGSHPNGSNDAYLTLAGQLVRDGYHTGERRTDYTTAYRALVGTFVDATINPNTAVADSVQLDHWKVNGTTTYFMTPDGVHMGPQGHLAAVTPFRTQVEAL